MKTFTLSYQTTPRDIFRYTIKSKDISNTPLYQVRRSSFRKYRQFEDMNENALFYIGITTIKSVGDEEILANMQMDGKTIETAIGNFILTDLDIFRRSYILKMNDNTVAHVKRKWHLIRDRHIIEMNDIHDRYQAFVFALLVLIDSILGIMQPIIHSDPMYVYVPNNHVKSITKSLKPRKTACDSS